MCHGSLEGILEKKREKKAPPQQGYVRGIEQARSLLTAHEDYTTLEYRHPTEIQKPGLVYAYLHQKLPQDSVERVARLALTKDCHGAVFDVPSELVKVCTTPFPPIPAAGSAFTNQECVYLRVSSKVDMHMHFGVFGQVETDLSRSCMDGRICLKGVLSCPSCVSCSFLTSIFFLVWVTPSRCFHVSHSCL
jgi:GUCT (NUC152) domain